ncbi:MAG: saccharopine dehydrogenase NADP-binding domain-containing protein, partial [Bacteroidota bacterium]|nr:saccharopine dehydrogenase NADP-binding domain-containing protein [Bacteroidota bacterium]
MKFILIFGAGKSATNLIEYLGKACDENDWNLLVCDSNLQSAQSKISGFKNAKALSADVSDAMQRASLIQKADIVISMLPPHLHFLVARDCVDHSKHLLTASYIDDKIKFLEKEIKEKKLLFLCEMGLDPGIDHMSAMKIIDRLKKNGGEIISFKSHCGGLVAPESDDNPWHYKITWNPGNIVMAGSSGAMYKRDGETVKLLYEDVFADCTEVVVPELFALAWYPNRDSLSYVSTYGLEDINTFIRTTLRDPSFCRGWNKIVNLGFTNLNDHEIIKECSTYSEWFNKKVNIFFADKKQRPGISPAGKEKLLDVEFTNQLDYLGMREDVALMDGFTSSASLLQHLLETRLAITPEDKDMVVMLHEIGYMMNAERKMISSSLIVKGTDQVHTAMAKTVGLPLGIAAKLLMQEKIK